MERPYLWQFDPSRYKRAYLFGKVHEAQVQADIRSALGLLGIQVDWIDAGGAAIRGKIMGALRRMGFSEEVVKKVLAAISDVSASTVGHSDLSGVLWPGVPFFIEVKAPAWLRPTTGGVLRPAGIPSADQLDFLDGKHRDGALVGVAWSVDDALGILGDAIARHRTRKKN